MKEGGILFFLLGGIALIVGFMIDVTAATEYVPGAYSIAMPSRVANLHAMHIQGLVFQGAFAALILGGILYGFGAVAERLDAGRRADRELGGEAGQAAAAASPASPVAAPVEPSDWVGLALIIGAVLAVFLALAVWTSSGRGGGSSASNPSSDAGSGSDVTSDAENAINQANSDLENAQAMAENALREAEEGR
jgi:hypothetical protein